MYELPTSVEINGELFNIREKGDYRMVLQCFKALEDMELSSQERVLACLMTFYEDFDTVEDVLKFPNLDDAIQAMYIFIDCGEKNEISAKTTAKLIDWEEDAVLITSAVNAVAQKEIRSEEYLHWWTFIGYYMAIGESALSTIVSIRSKLAKHEKLEKYEKKFVEENPKYFSRDYRTTEQKEFDEYLKNLWEGG